VTTTDLKDCASLGAALVSFLSIGQYNSLKEAKENISIKDETFKLGENRKVYGDLFKHYNIAVKSLGPLKSIT